MKKNIDPTNSSRRDFIKKTSSAITGLLVLPYLKPSGVFAYDHNKAFSSLATVALSNTLDSPADTYIYDDEQGGVKQKLQSLFEQLGGISDIFGAEKKVVIKINLTGGSSSASDEKLSGVPITEAMWTHPAVVRAVTESIIETGVSASDIIIVESLGGYDNFNNDVFQDYVDVKNDLGCQLVNITEGTFVDVSTGDNYFNFPKLSMNQIVQETDVYVSIGKLKHHAEAGITCSIKNQVGSVPQSSYTTKEIQYRRQAIHSPTNESSASFLPRSICDLFAARPVHLAVIDGIKNATGGEGVWNPNFAPSESHVLITGKDPVAADSIGAYLMGLDCEASKIKLPGNNGYGDTECDNYLELLHNRGIGTNQLSEITVVGDGKDLVTDIIPDRDFRKPVEFQLCANYPNPFNPSTMVTFYMPKKEFVTLRVYDIMGREIEVLIQGEVPAGEHRLQWSAEGLASGMYICRMITKSYARSIKMLYQK